VTASACRDSPWTSDDAPGDEPLWAARVQSALGDALARYGATHHLASDHDVPPEAILTDWTAFPARIARCLTRKEACALLDWRSATGDRGRNYQEEYAEWRTVRTRDGKIRRFELTTELPDYWVWLSAHNPTRTLELLASFAGEETVDPQAVYGERDPGRETFSEAQRERAFTQHMLGTGKSPYNNGIRAICCMRQPTNTLGALLGLIVASCRARLARDEVSGMVRCANAVEVIPQLKGAAELGRNSDPVLVEQLTRLACEGRLIALDGPPGVYIHGIQLERLTAPDGSQIPAEWFSFQRTTALGTSPPETAGAQRLVFEVPPEHGICIGDLIDLATGAPVCFGAELADLVQLAVHIRTTAPGVVKDTMETISRVLPDPVAARRACDEILAGWRDFESAVNATASGHGEEGSP
jgi:hypothetical protein